MRAYAFIALIAGVGLATLLILSHDWRAVWHSTALIGSRGFAAVVVCHGALIALMGVAWWLLGRTRADGTLARFVWGRLVRDSAAEALPLSQIGGYVLGARALALAGVSGVFAAASTVVDITVELVAQLAYTFLGLLLLDRLDPDNTLSGPALVGLAAMGALVAIFAAIQVRGTGHAERMGRWLARGLLGRRIGEAGTVQAAMAQIHARRAALSVAVTVHFAAWVLSGAETWIALRLMAVPRPLSAALIIDSLLYGMRSVAFMVPNSLGVQEGTLILLGGLFGIGPATSLGLSLVRRARDLAIGIPALLAWQALEGKHALRPNLLLEGTEGSPSP